MSDEPNSSPGDQEQTSSLVAFPRERSADRPLDNLPLELTSFIGREREVAEVERLLRDRRLLTLCGPGGSGKTRLALAVAQELVEVFEDGVWWVELAPDLRPETPGAGCGRGARRARVAGHILDRGSRGLSQATRDAPRAGQLRAPGRGVRRPRCHAAQGLPRSGDPRDKQGAPARNRRVELAGAQPLPARARTPAGGRRAGRLRGHTPLRRAGQRPSMRVSSLRKKTLPWWPGSAGSSTAYRSP